MQCLKPEQRGQDTILVLCLRMGVQQHRMLVGIVGRDEFRHRNALRIILPFGAPMDGAILFAQIPKQSRMVAKTRDQFAKIKLAQTLGVPAIQQQFVLGFLQNNMQGYAAPLHVVKEDFPLR